MIVVYNPLNIDLNLKRSSNFIKQFDDDNNTAEQIKEYFNSYNREKPTEPIVAFQAGYTHNDFINNTITVFFYVQPQTEKSNSQPQPTT